MRHHEPGWPTTLEEFRVWHERQPKVWEFIEGVPTLMAPGSKGTYSHQDQCRPRTG